MAKARTSGVGIRYALVAGLGSNGLPATGSASATLSQGTLVERIKTFSPSDPEPQRVTHYGDDLPYAQDQLPPAEIGSFVVTTGQTNLTLDALISGTKAQLVGTGEDEWQVVGGNTDKRGAEPRVMFMTYRQALDTGKGSSTAGTRRQWHVKLYPSVQLSPSSQPFEQNSTDKTYNATPTPVAQAAWGQTFTEATNGFTQAEFLEWSTDYQPRANWGIGNGTLTAFNLSHPPATATSLKVWVNGTLQTPSGVNTSATNPAFTLGAAPANNAFIFAVIETNAPGNT